MSMNRMGNDLIQTSHSELYMPGKAVPDVENWMGDDMGFNC